MCGRFILGKKMIKQLKKFNLSLMIEVVVLISLVGTAAIALLNENKTVVNEQYSFIMC